MAVQEMLRSIPMEKKSCGSFPSSRVGAGRDPSETVSRFRGGVRPEQYEKLLARENTLVMRRSMVAGTVEKAGERKGCGSFPSSRLGTGRGPSETLRMFEGNVRPEQYEKLLARENTVMRPRHRDGDEQPMPAGTVEKAGERKVLFRYPSAAEPLRTLQAPTGGSCGGEVQNKRKLVIKMTSLASKKPKLQQEAGPKPLEPKAMTRELREHIEGKLRGTEIFFVCQKKLTTTDVSEHHKRLSVPKSRISSPGFLREDERARLEVSPDEKDGHKSGGIRVLVMDPSRELRMPTFTKWDSGKAVYVLTTSIWTNIVKKNSLKKDDEIQIWSFRVLDLLSMAIVIVKRAPTPRKVP